MEKTQKFFDAEPQAMFEIPVVHSLNQDSKDFLSAFKSDILTAIGDMNGAAVSAVHDARDLLNEVFLSNPLTDALSTLSKACWVIPIVCMVYYASTRLDLSPYVPPILAFLTLLLPVMFKPMLDLLRQYLNNTFAQVSGIDFSFIKKLITMGTVLVGFKHFNGDFYEYILGMLTFGPRKMATADGYAEFIAWVITGFEDVVNVIRKFFGKENISFMRTGEKEVDDWANRLDLVLTGIATDEIKVDCDIVHVLSALKNEATHLAKQYRLKKDVAIVLERYLRRLDDLCSKNSAVFSAAKNTRVEPVCLALAGKPGIGKTLLCTVIAAEVIARITSLDKLQSDNYNVASDIFQKGSSKFDNGYVGQAVYVMDDAFQQVYAEGDQDNDFMKIIRVVNSWMLPLDFADVENKGKNFFRSKFVMLTTNVFKLTNMAEFVINDPSAVVRRLHHPYELGVADAYRLPGKGKWDPVSLDTDRITEFFREHGRVPLEAWVVRKHNYSTGVPFDGQELTLRHVIDSIVNDIARNKDRHDDMNNVCQGIVDSIISEKLSNQDRVEPQVGVSPTPRDTQECLLEGEAAGMHNGFSFYKYLMPIHDMAVAAAEFAYLGKVVRTETEKYCMKLAMSLKKGLIHIMTSIRDAWWNFEALLRDNPILGIFLCSVSMYVIVLLVKTALGSIAASYFQEKAVEQVVNFKTLTELSGKAELKMCVAKRVVKNMYRAFIILGDGRYMHLGNILGICGKVFNIPTHFFKAISNVINSGEVKVTDKFVLINCFNNSHSFELTVDSFLALPRQVVAKTDSTFVKFCVNVAAGDISKKFLYRKDIGSFNAFDCTFASSTQDANNICINWSHSRAERMKTTLAVGVSKDLSYEVKDSFKYQIPTTGGDCGGILFLGVNVRDFNGARIVGFHTGGNPSTGNGFSNVVTREQVEEALRHFEQIVEEDVTDANVVAESGNQFVDGSFLPLYEVEKGMQSAPYSKLCKTPLFGLWGENKKYPTPLGHHEREGVVIKPMINAVKKYSGKVRVYNEKEIQSAAYVALYPITKSTSKVVQEDRIVLTFEQAILGEEGNPMMTSIPRNTSSGYPRSLEKGISGKKDFFGFGDDYDLTSANANVLREDVTEIINCAKSGVRKLHVFTDFLKDERRPDGKGARLVSGAPIAYVVAFRMYFLKFISATMDGRIENGCCAGINVYSEWQYLWNYLTTVSTTGIAGDYSAFDSSEQPQIHDEILSFICKWYGGSEEDNLVRKVLWLELIHSRHLGGDGKQNNIIYQWFHSLPSGHPATTIVNSMYNLILFGICYQRLTGSMIKYHERVRVVVLGDDNVVAIDPSIQKVFNQDTITEVMADLGMTYTSEDKDTHVEPIRELANVTFLKRGFRFEDGQVLGPLSLDTIREMAYWCRNKANMEEITQSNFETALIELSAHGEEVWNTIGEEMIEKYQATGRRTTLFPSRENYLKLFTQGSVVY